MKFSWSRWSGYEVSSKGDKRFSAFNAILKDGRSIEVHYQCDVKGWEPNGSNWRLGKGKPPKTPLTSDELWFAYLDLWWQWAEDHPQLMEELRQIVLRFEYSGMLRDRFATTPINQARALAEMLNAIPNFLDRPL